MCKAAGGGESGERRRRPLDAQCFGPFGKNQGCRVQLMWAIGITRTFRSPRIAKRSGNPERLLDFGVVIPHFSPIERPVEPVTELAARLEPFGPESERHHGEMDCRPADAFSRIVGA